LRKQERLHGNDGEQVMEDNEILETTHITYQGGGHKTSIPKRIIQSLKWTEHDSLVWQIKEGRIVLLIAVKDIFEKAKIQ